jgi:hypothetical protein
MKEGATGPYVYPVTAMWKYCIGCTVKISDTETFFLLQLFFSPDEIQNFKKL